MPSNTLNRLAWSVSLFCCSATLDAQLADRLTDLPYLGGGSLDAIGDLASHGLYATVVADGVLWFSDATDGGTGPIARGATVLAATPGSIWAQGDGHLFWRNTESGIGAQVRSFAFESFGRLGSVHLGSDDRLVTVADGNVIVATPEGVEVVLEGSFRSGFAQVGTHLLFEDRDFSMWASDGTREGTVKISPSLIWRLATERFAYGVRRTPSGDFLWRTDGTLGGTRAVGGPHLQDWVTPRWQTSRSVFMVGGEERRELWKIGDDQSQAVLVAEFPEGWTLDFGFGVGQRVAETETHSFVFVLDVSESMAWLWSVDARGRAIPLLPVGAPGSGPDIIIGNGLGHVFLDIGRLDEASNGLWATDGTESGSRQLEEVQWAVEWVDGLGLIQTQPSSEGEILYFDGRTGNREVFGMTALADGRIEDAVLVGDRLLYRTERGLGAADRGLATGRQFRSLVTYDYLAPRLIPSSGPRQAFVLPGEAGFYTRFGATGESEESTDLWDLPCISQGVQAVQWSDSGTAVVCTFRMFHFDQNGRMISSFDDVRELGNSADGTVLYYELNTLGGGSGLWSTDGTATGSRLLHPGQDFLKTNLPGLLRVGLKGSQLVEFLWIDPDSGEVVRLVGEYSSRALAATTGPWIYVLEPVTGVLMRHSKLTGAQVPLEGAFPEGVAPFDMATFGSRIVLFAGEGTGNAIRAWTLSDSSTVATLGARLQDVPVQVADLEDILLLFSPTSVAAMDSVGSTVELLHHSEQFISDVEVHRDRQMAFFALESDDTGREVWASDGSIEGTRLLHDISPGPPSSDPGQFVAKDDKVFFTADDGLAGQQVWAIDLAQPECRPGTRTLCLEDRRFRVQADWRTGNESGFGRAVHLTGDSGTFWFFDQANLEVIVKVLDGRGVNEHFWTFMGALTDVEYYVTVTDVDSGRARRYGSPNGRFASGGDVRSFSESSPARESGGAPYPKNELSKQQAGACVPGPSRLCLGDRRFEVEIRWADFRGESGFGQAQEMTDDTGGFWFFDSANVEVVVKILDARSVNGRFWVYFASLTNVEFELSIRDTDNNASRSYRNPLNRFASFGDVDAFLP